jgi:hypothetical protein
MDFDTLDVLYRSRITLLKVLKARGYDTAAYEVFGPFEIKAMAAGAAATTAARPSGSSVRSRIS